MSDCKTGAEHIKSLQDGRTVYLDGKLVGDVTAHPAFRNAVHSAAALYDFQAQPENLEFMTFRPNGSNRRVNRAWQMPRNYDEMVQRRKAMQAWAAQSGGYFGRSPDHLASSLVGQRMGIDVFRKHSPERAKALIDYFDYASKNDLFLTYVIINPQAERGKDWGEQDEDLVARIVDEDSERRHHPGRQDARHFLDHGQRGFRRQSAAAQARRGGPRLFLRRADERQGHARSVAQILRSSTRFRCTTIRSRRASTRTTR